MAKVDVLLEKINNIQEDVTEIKEHLKNLNGSVIENSRKINELRITSKNIKYVLALAIPVVAIVVNYLK